MRAALRVLVVLGVAAAAPAPAPAQRVAVGAALWGAGVKARSVYPGGREALSGQAAMRDEAGFGGMGDGL